MLWADLVLITIAILTFLALLTALGSLWVWVPYVPTPWPVVRKMVELAKMQGDETVYDLGCGDARLLIQAKRTYPAITAIGYELPLGIWLLAKFRVALARLRIDVHMRDFRKADLSDADVIFLYLIPETFAALERKFDAEIRPGTKIISHGFPLPGKTPLLVERCPLWTWRMFNRKGKVGPRIFVYQW